MFSFVTVEKFWGFVPFVSKQSWPETYGSEIMQRPCHSHTDKLSISSHACNTNIGSIVDIVRLLEYSGHCIDD